MQKIGIGYDIHRLAEGRKLFLGGVEIPYVKGLVGHSDADALLHAICDALLGAISGGDIGEHFPDTDPAYEGVSSLELLRKTYGLVKNKNFSVENIDAIIIAQEPNLSPFKRLMRSKISEALGLPEKNINIKAKTNEGLGETGRKEAIACYAAVMINKE